MKKLSLKQGLQIATRKAERNHDARKLDYIQKHLNQANILTKREVSHISEQYHTPNNTRVPDLTFIGRDIVLEHDTTKIHGELGWENERTLNRNKDYCRAGVARITINQDLAKHLGLDEANLAIYLYYHKISELKASF